MYLRKKFGLSMRHYVPITAICLFILLVSFTAVSAFGNAGQVTKALVEALIQPSADNNSASSLRIQAAAQPAGTLPVYRFFNTETGTHFYTISEDEKNYILANWPQFHFYGSAFYAYPIVSQPTPA